MRTGPKRMWAAGALIGASALAMAGTPAGAAPAPSRAEKPRDLARPAPAAPGEACDLHSSLSSPRDEWQSCVGVGAHLSRAPAVGETATLTVTVRADAMRPDGSIDVTLPSNLEFVDAPAGMRLARAAERGGSRRAEHASLARAFAKGDALTYRFLVRATAPGSGEIAARASAAVAHGVDAGADSVFLTVADSAAGSKLSIAAPAVSGTTTAAAASTPAGAKARFRALPKTSLPQPRSAGGPGARLRANAAAPGSACVSGSWFYVDNNGVTRPAKNFVVQAWDRDTTLFSGGDDLLASGFVGFNGAYTLCFSNDDPEIFEGGGADVYVRFVSENSRWKVNASGNPMAFTTGVVDNVADGSTTSFGGLQPADNNLMRGMHAYDEVADAWNWVPLSSSACWDQNDTSCRQVVVQWGPSSTDGTFYSTGSNDIHLKADDPNAPITVVHELGHALMDDMYEDAFPPAPSCNPHSIPGSTSAGCAWTEGFAEWFPAMVYQDKSFRWPSGAVQDLEGPTWGTPGWQNGDTVEGRIAGSLIDVSDFENEAYWDRSNVSGFAPGSIWSTVANRNPTTLGNFFAWRSVDGFDVSAAGERGTLYQNTVDYQFRDPLAAYVPLVRPTPTPHNFSYLTTTGRWSLLAVRPTTGDDDLQLWDDFGQTAFVSGSAYAGNTIDFVAISPHRGLGDYYPRVNPFAGGSPYAIQLAQGNAVAGMGAFSVFMGANDVARVYDVGLAAGQTATFRVVPLNGSDPELFLLGDDPGNAATWVRSRAQYAAGASAGGPGQAEQFTYTAPAAGTYGLALLSKSGSGWYTVYVDDSAPTGTVSIAGGAAKTPKANVALALSGTDAQSGVDRMRISTDGVLDTEPWIAYAPSALVTLSAGDGVKTVLAQFANRVGLVSALASDTIVLDTRADLVVSSITNPPAARNRGATFPLAETTFNAGPTGAGASTTRYYLSVNTTKQAGDVLLAPTRAVPALGPGATSTGSVTLRVPATVALGSYHVLACADDLNVVGEYSNANNCRSSLGLVTVTAPDLRVTGLASPPVSRARGATFVGTDTTRNAGSGHAGASRTRYYLSADLVRNAGDTVLGPARVVPGLNALVSSAGSVTLTVPAAMAKGTYHLIACADGTSLVPESNEANNCRATAATIKIV